MPNVVVVSFPSNPHMYIKHGKSFERTFFLHSKKTREDMCLHKLLLTFLAVVFIINCVLIETNELIDEHDDNINNVGDYYMRIVKITNHLSMLVNGTTKATANAIANKALEVSCELT